MHASLTYAIDREHDLALLRALSAPKHGVARTRRGAIEQGLPVQSMGMPVGLWFTYATGSVSAVRPWAIQTTTPASPGCSGSGLFDLDGDLIGIGHSMSTKATLASFYTPKSIIETFLSSQGAAL